ncbi:MAG: glycosyltransferase family 39 protein [Rhodocyclales bacterium]|nr:glycosyltransferase family 39 protein [Rhodocyclales bacterium]
MSARLFAVLLALTLIFRVWLAAAVPITGDEAYFIWWGWRPDWGFYDHPPMIGWWLAALLKWRDSEAWLRLPVIVQPALLALAVAWALPHLAPRLSAAQRYWMATLVLLAPVNVWNVFITTDTPLVYFSVFSGLAWLRAAQDDDLRWYLLAGVLLAGAVLSKYFAALLGFAYLVDVLLRRRPRAVAGLALCYAATLPALALMAWWNAGHCWPNYMFNFVNRNEDAGFSLRTPPLYLVTLLYVLTPPALWLALRRSRGAAMSFRRLASASALRPFGNFPAMSTLGVLAWAPFVLFAGLSLVKQIGLHWLLAFLPFTLIWIALRLAPETLRRLGLFFLGFAALHVAAIAVVSRLPLETWQKSRMYDGIVLTVEHEAILKELAPYRNNDWVLAMDGYSNAVTMGYNARQYFIVFGEASSHARHDDILTDFRTLAGRNILVLRKSEPSLAEYQPYFRRVTLDSFTVRGARFWRVKGEGFDYPAYRDGILAQVKRKYYALPPWLPQTACYFCERYFPEAACRR